MSTDDRAFYRVTVFLDEADIDDDPIVDGIISLDERASWDLAERFSRLHEAGVLRYDYVLERYETPAVFTVDGIFNSIAGLPDDEDNRERRAQLEPIWNGTATVPG